ncbi:FISUMP domain-containing protein [Fibrobacter sp. UWCM]|uniref:FISUMP domain-containing protein n=1 Tax=Fibrobacter sp. UWCM TaxID=1896208 RepID=UPI0009345239|nr:FISUMP domain-containing protein [Fibrobacter sp. UWCM]
MNMVVHEPTIKKPTNPIGDQTWMAENLNFDPGQGGSGDYKYRWSWCYDNKKKNCDVGGRLYTWAAAIDSLKLANDVENPIECGDRKYCDSLPARIRGVCIEGWHLPSRDEWNDLIMMAVDTANAGRIFKSLTGWVNGGNGTDSLGFSALPVGYYQDNGKYYGAGGISRMWSSQSVNDLFATEMGFNSNSNGFVLNFGVGYKSFAYSVRCVKD